MINAIAGQCVDNMHLIAAQRIRLVAGLADCRTFACHQWQIDMLRVDDLRVADLHCARAADPLIVEQLPIAGIAKAPKMIDKGVLRKILLRFEGRIECLCAVVANPIDRACRCPFVDKVHSSRHRTASGTILPASELI
jgi:hypothetical protein